MRIQTGISEHGVFLYGYRARMGRLVSYFYDNTKQWKLQKKYRKWLL